MAMTLEDYAADYLPGRGLPWPVAPKIEPLKAKPHLAPLPVKAVLWTVYGTLLAIPQGEIVYEHEHDFVTDAALDKTIQEFKMWQSMSRKPGAPAEYMRELFKKAYTTLKMAGSGGEKFPEIQTERIWDDIVKKLNQKEYKYDIGTLGTMPEFVKKIAYFYHASIQGYGAYPNAVAAVRHVADSGRLNGLLTDGQCFTPAQLHKAFREQDPAAEVNSLFPPAMRIISAEKKARKPSETLFQAAVAAIAARGLTPGQVLHVGSNILRDIGPAKKHGFKTALFAGDKLSLVATGEQLKDPLLRPDVMMTDLAQIADVLV